MWTERRKRNTIIGILTVVLISSVPLTIVFSLAVYNFKQPPPIWGGVRFPLFHLEEPFLYADYFSERFIILNNSDYQQLDLLGHYVLKTEGLYWPITKYNNYLFRIRPEHHFGETPEYLYYLEIIDVDVAENPNFVTELLLYAGSPLSFDQFYTHEFMEFDNKLYLFLQEDERYNPFVVNCTNMQQPVLLDSYQFPGDAGVDYNKLYKFYIRDNFVFIPTLNATSSVGLTIYNFTALDNLTKIGEWFGSTNLTSFDSVYASEDLLYFKKKNSGVEVFDIQNLTHPTRSGFVAVPGYGLFCHQNYTFGFYHFTFSIFDCTNTSQTEPIFTYEYPWDTYIHINYMSENLFTNDYFYLPMDEYSPINETLHIWDWSDPSSPTIKVKLGLPSIPRLIESPHWTYTKIVVPIIVGDALIATVGIVLLRYLKRKK